MKFTPKPMTKTTIEWTNETWNPVTGCTKVSQGCKHCYAERLAHRVFAGQMVEVNTTPPKHPEMKASAFRPRHFTDVRCHPDRLANPLHWKKPRRIFVNSMSDLFHEDVPDGFIDQVFAMMALTPEHTYQVLTKRPERMLKYMSSGHECEGPRYRLSHAVDPSWFGHEVFHDGIAADIHDAGWPLLNAWLGVSVEDQATADVRIPPLLRTPAAIRFVSCEPLLDKIDLRSIELEHLYWLNALTSQVKTFHDGGMPEPPPYPPLNWVITGGESGPHARVTDLDWVRFLRDQCRHDAVPFFVKQITVCGKKIPFEDWPANLRIRNYPAAILKDASIA